jgi:predicted NUDIX family NTP pyrophosphohydrolase
MDARVAADRLGSTAMARQSAGLLLYRPGGRVGGPEVLLVHPGGPFFARKDAGVWSVPKGEYEPGEDPLEVALREFEEEIGVPAPVAREALVELGSVRQKGGKVVTVWGAPGDLDVSEIQSMPFTIEWPPRSGRFQAFPEVDRADWFTIAEARVKLNPAQAELLDRLEALLARA